MYQWIKQKTFGVQLISKLYKFRRPAAKPKRQISWFFKSNLCSAPGWHICSLELWIWWHLLHQLSKELLEESQVSQALPLRCVCQIGFQDHSRSPLFPKFFASFVVQGTWLRPTQRCHHPQRPDVAPHVLPRCLLRWLFELVIDRDHDPGTKRIGGAFQNFLWFRTLQDGTPLSALCFSAADMLTDQRLFLCLLHVQRMGRAQCPFQSSLATAVVFMGGYGHLPLRSENFLISCGHCDPEGIAEFSNFSRYYWWKKSCTTWYVWNPANNGIFVMWNWCRMFASINRGWCLTHDFCFVSPMTLQESPNVSERQELQSLVSKWRADDMEAWASLVPLIPKILHFLPSIFVGTWNKSPKYSKSILSTDTGLDTLDRWFTDTDVGKCSKEVWSVGFDSVLVMDTSCMPTSYRVIYQ